MIFFGKRKFPPLDSLPEDKWSVSQGENNGKPMFIRMNSSAKQYAGHPELPVRLGIAVPLNDPNDHGLPKETESDQLGQIEDRLVELIGTAGRVVLIIT